MDTLHPQADKERIADNQLEEEEEEDEKHQRIVEEYMSRLLEKTPSKKVPDNVIQPPLDVPGGESNILGSATPAVEETPSARRPGIAPENRATLSQMREVANESANCSLVTYESKLERAAVRRIGISVLLLGACGLLFELDASGRTGLYLLGIFCWLVAAAISISLLRHL